MVFGGGVCLGFLFLVFWIIREEFLEYYYAWNLGDYREIRKATKICEKFNENVIFPEILKFRESIVF